MTFQSLVLMLASIGAAATHLPPAVDPPFRHADVAPVGLPDRVDRQSALVPLPAGGFLLVYESARRAGLDDLVLWGLHSADGAHLGAVHPVQGLAAGLTASPWGGRCGEQLCLWFASADSLEDPPRLWRARVDPDGRVHDPQALAVPSGLRRLLGWPRWSDGLQQPVLSFRGARSRPHWTRDTEAVAPAVASIGEVGGAYVRVVPMTGGGWLLSYQRPAPDHYMVTYTRRSLTGRDWTDPAPLSLPAAPGKADVHDAYALPRRDRGVDLYYVYPSLKQVNGQPSAEFDLYRRAVLPDGRHGPEQRLHASADFNPFTPSAHRVADGSVLLSFADIRAREQGAVSEAPLVLVRLHADAPLE